MAMNDILSDSLTRLRNAQMARLSKTSLLCSKSVEGVLAVLLKEGYIRGYKKVNIRKNIDEFEVELKYYEGKPVISQLKRESKPGRRYYSKIADLQKHYNGLGTIILTTPKGVMSDYDAVKHNVGGEVLCSVF